MAHRCWVGTTQNWNTSTNWYNLTSGIASGVPVSGDTVSLWTASKPITSGLDQSSVVLHELNIYHTATGEIGTDTAFLQICASGVNIGLDSPYSTASGSPRIKLDLGTTPTNVTVYNSSTTSSDAYFAPIQLKLINTGNTLTIVRGRVNVACGLGETSTLERIEIESNASNVVRFGSAVTYDELLMRGGTFYAQTGCDSITIDGGTTTISGNPTVTSILIRGGSLNASLSGLTTLTAEGGELSLYGSAAISGITILGGSHSIECGNVGDILVADGTLSLDSGNVASYEQDGGTVTFASVGSITSMTVSGGTCNANYVGTISDLKIDGGTVDFTQSVDARTVTDLTMYPSSKIKLNTDYVTITNNIEADGDITLSAT